MGSAIKMGDLLWLLAFSTIAALGWRYRRVLLPAVEHNRLVRFAANHVRRAWWRRSWEEAMTCCNLAKRYKSRLVVPKLVRVSRTEYFWRLRVRMVRGQEPRMFAEASRVLAHSLGSTVCRVRRVEGKPKFVDLHVQRKDALRATVPVLPIPSRPDLDAIPMGRTEFGGVWRQGVLGTHTLVGGATGAGKASLLWSMMRGLGPVIHDGSVQVWGIDPKGGQELVHGCGRDGQGGLFARYAGENAELKDMAALLADLVEVMMQRSRDAAGNLTRVHEPTPAEPAILCVIDELADLTTCTDGQLRNQMIAALEKIARRGRSVGVYLWLMVQTIRKDAVPFRDLIPDGICLRVDEAPWQVDAILGPGAFAHGADALSIPGRPGPDQPIDGRGVAYVRRLGETESTRVRASYVTDEDIWALAEQFPAPVIQREEVV